MRILEFRRYWMIMRALAMMDNFAFIFYLKRLCLAVTGRLSSNTTGRKFQHDATDNDHRSRRFLDIPT